jgi:predicted transcriptional regulator
MATVKSTFTLPENITFELNSFAEELNEKKSNIIRNALLFYFDYLDLKIAEKRAGENSERLSADELRKELGL